MRMEYETVVMHPITKPIHHELNPHLLHCCSQEAPFHPIIGKITQVPLIMHINSKQKLLARISN